MTSKKLLVLDVNGLLVDTYFHKEPLPDESPDARVGSFYVYKRPFCEEFLQFCLENFTVGVWSSAREYNVNNLVDYVFGGLKKNLAFSWHQSDCTDLGLKSPDNQLKPLFLKELTKLWRRVKGDLPWKEGNYGPSNTLLVDDTPYKAILNPPNTAIFPCSYTARNHGDNFLGAALRSYLEGIRDAESVQTYVENNPFGEPGITPASPLWSYVNDVVLKTKNILNNVSNGAAQIMPVEAVSNDGIEENKPKKFYGKWKRLSDSCQPVDEFVDVDYQAGKHMRWKKKNTKLEYQPANDHLQTCEIDFSPKIVEQQSSELQSRDCCMLQPLKSDGQMLGSDADKEVLDTPLDQTRWVSSHSSQSIGEQERPLKQERPFQVGEGISNLPFGFEESPDAIRDRSVVSSELESFDGHDEEHYKNPGSIWSFDQGRQRALDLAKPVANMQENLQRIDRKCKENQDFHDGKTVPFDKQGNMQGSFTSVTEARTDGELDSLQEGRQDVVARILHSERNESNEKLRTSVSIDRVKSSEPYQMEAERNREEAFLGRQKSRDNSFVHASNTNNASQHRANWHKHTGTPKDLSRRYNPRHDSDLNRRYNPRHDSNRGRFGYSQDWKSEERYRRGARGETPYSKHFDNRGHHFANKKRVDRQNLDEEYRNFNDRRGIKPPAQSACSSTHDSRRWDQSPAQPAWVSTHVGRSWDQSQHDRWQFSNMKTPANASFGAPDNNFFSSQRGSTGWVWKNDEYGQSQGGDPLSCSWKQGLDQGLFCERSNPFFERTEQLNLNVHNPDSNFARQAETMGSWKRQRFDLARNSARASSQSHSGVSTQPYQNAEASSEPYWNVGFFSQPSRGQHGGSRQAYNNTRAYQPYHKRRDEYRHGLPSGGFSRSRQSQEVRSS